jgi:hypothetical protein
MVALGPTEALNLDRFAGNPPTMVYVNGTLLLVAGVAILQAHNRWSKGWPVLVTVIGWILVLGGLYRMIAPAAPQAASGPATYALLAVIAGVGSLLCLKGYGRRLTPEDSHG